MDIQYKVATEKGFEEALADLNTSLSEHKFGVLWELSFRDKLAEKGLEFDKNFTVLEVCNPKQAKEVLESNMEAGYFLPCKMVVYEDNGTVYLGMPRPTGLISLIDDDLLEVATSVETVLKAAIEEAK